MFYLNVHNKILFIRYTVTISNRHSTHCTNAPHIFYFWLHLKFSVCGFWFFYDLHHLMRNINWIWYLWNGDVGLLRFFNNIFLFNVMCMIYVHIICAYVCVRKIHYFDSCIITLFYAINEIISFYFTLLRKFSSLYIY